MAGTKSGFSPFIFIESFVRNMATCIEIKKLAFFDRLASSYSIKKNIVRNNKVKRIEFSLIGNHPSFLKCARIDEG
jgi:hypothetical protein